MANSIYPLLNPSTFRNKKIGQNGNIGLNILEAHQNWIKLIRPDRSTPSCMGEESEEVLASIITEEEDQRGEQQQQTYNSVIEKFGKLLRVRKNVIFEKVRFN